MQTAKQAGGGFFYRSDTRGTNTIFRDGFLPGTLDREGGRYLPYEMVQAARYFDRHLRAFKREKTRLSHLGGDKRALRRAKAAYAETHLGLRSATGDLGWVNVTTSEGHRIAQMICFSPFIWGAAIFAVEPASSHPIAASRILYVCWLDYTKILKTSKRVSFTHPTSMSPYGVDFATRTSNLTSVNEVATSIVPRDKVLLGVQIRVTSTHFLQDLTKGTFGISVGSDCAINPAWAPPGDYQDEAADGIINAITQIGHIHNPPAPIQFIYDLRANVLMMVPEDLAPHYSVHGTSWSNHQG